MRFYLALNYYNKLRNQSDNWRLEKLVIYNCLLVENKSNNKNKGNANLLAY